MRRSPILHGLLLILLLIPASWACAVEPTAQQPRWIWATATEGQPADKAVFRATFQVSEGLRKSLEKQPIKLHVAVQGECQASLNGHKLGAIEKGKSRQIFKLPTEGLRAEEDNLLALHVNSAETRAAIKVRMFVSAGEMEETILASNASWRASGEAPEAWSDPQLDDSNWLAAVTSDDLDPEDRLALIRSGKMESPLLMEMLDRSEGELPEAELAALRTLDDEFPPLTSAAEDRLERSVLTALALSGEFRSLGQLHEVFETFPERRNAVAVALARFAQQARRRTQDWRLLVRSLMLVRDEDAREVLQALERYRERATRPSWVRQVIILGLRLGEHGAADAVALLEHWTDEKIGQEGDMWQDQLAAWQAWFRKTHPQSPEPKLPQESPNAKWKYADLAELAYSPAADEADAERGAAVFDKAQCRKCHRYGRQGERIGPDLTDIKARLQRRELIEGILFPSQRISDQFLSYTVVTRDGRSFIGVIGDSGADALVILQANGEKVEIQKDFIEQAERNRTSSMPGNLLETLSRQEILDLMAYLRSTAKD